MVHSFKLRNKLWLEWSEKIRRQAAEVEVETDTKLRQTLRIRPLTWALIGLKQRYLSIQASPRPATTAGSTQLTSTSKPLVQPSNNLDLGGLVVRMLPSKWFRGHKLQIWLDTIHHIRLGMHRPAKSIHSSHQRHKLPGLLKTMLWLSNVEQVILGCQHKARVPIVNTTLAQILTSRWQVEAVE